jgi:hypothetical protein
MQFDRNKQERREIGNHWLCGNLFKKALFCWPCLLLSTAKQNVWVCQGYSDLKKHESSKQHLTNILSLKRLNIMKKFGKTEFYYRI